MRWQRWFIQLHRHGACTPGLLLRSIGRGRVQEAGDYVHGHTTGKLPVWPPEKQATDDKLLEALFGLILSWLDAKLRAFLRRHLVQPQMSAYRAT